MNHIVLARTMLGATLALAAPALTAQAQSPAAAQQAGILRQVGALVSIDGQTLVFKTDAGQQYSVSVGEKTRLQRIAPGETSLKNAQPMELAGLKPGDRIRVLGRIGDDGRSVEAASIIAIKAEELADKRKAELQEWQKGVGGIVKSIDAANAVILVSSNGMSGSKEIAVHLAANASVKRYAPDSINFSEAKPSKLSELKAGDQLRARGARGEDATKFEASAIVVGSFRNISGKVAAIDAAANSVTVNDIATKKPVTLSLGANSQFRILPERMAQMLAMTLKGQTPGQGGWPGQRAGQGAPTAAAAAPANPGAAAANHGAAPGGWGGNHAGGPPSFSQMLGHLPAAKISDLKIGDVVMAVTTEGSADKVTAITLVGGVEPLLTASPKAGSLLSPWNLNTGGGGEGGGGESE